MGELRAVKSNGQAAGINSSAVETLRAALRGKLLLRGDSGYDEARTIWNVMIDKCPAMIVQCAGAADVRSAVIFAREHQLLLAVRGGGHNIAGSAVCEGGLMIDLSPMRSIHVDPRSRRAFVGPGATLGDFDHEAQAFGLATPLGINSTTGVAGLTLGGGFGWLSRKYGMTVDNLLSVDVVTAEGKFVHVSATEETDLFWVLRGGGGNFGVVTLFEYKLHPVGPDVLSGLVVYPAREAVSALKQYRDFVKKLGDDTSVWVVLRKAPPLPFLPEDAHGKDVLVFALCHVGDPAAGRKAIEPVRRFGTPLGEFIGVQPFTAWQKAFDPLLTPGARNYWKSHNFIDLSDEAIGVAVRFAQAVPSPHCEIFFGLLGGAASRVAPDAMAYSHRDARYAMNVHGRWERPEEDDRCIKWARDFFRESAPYASGGVYVNFLTADEPDRIRAAYGSGFDRLVKAKKTYDPENLFRMNQNISPTA